MLAVVVGAVLLSVSAAVRCPGSPAFMHASCSLEVTTRAACSTVTKEMTARVEGQSNGSWRDPHNGGTYKLVSTREGMLEFNRTTGSASIGNRKYTDRILFTYSELPGGGCHLTGCSESQVLSLIDVSTNYCNMWNLYCSKADGCLPVQCDFAYNETSVSPSVGAGTDRSKCIVVPAEPTRRLRQAAVDMSGFYVDPNHYQQGGFAGTRMLSIREGDEASALITLIGSDDGVRFWTLHGKVTSEPKGELVIDFSPKGGPANLSAVFSSGRLAFSDGNTWFRLHSQDCAASPPGPGKDHFDGVYVDPNHYSKGSFAGMRMVSDRKGDTAADDITLIGSDNGTLFWTLHGKFTDKEKGSLVIDFSPKGGPANLKATFSDARITYEDGNAWARKDVQECASSTPSMFLETSSRFLFAA